MRAIDFQDFVLEDPAWGDFDLLFHAFRKKLKCIQIPVHYQSRREGKSKMKALHAGLVFLTQCIKKWAQIP
jgi:hypothetical protein